MSCGKLVSKRTSRKIHPISEENNLEASSKSNRTDSFFSSCIQSNSSELTMDDPQSLSNQNESNSNHLNEALNVKREEIVNQSEGEKVLKNGKENSIPSVEGEKQSLNEENSSNEKDSSVNHSNEALGHNEEEKKTNQENSVENLEAKETEAVVNEIVEVDNNHSKENNSEIVSENDSQRILEIKTPPLPPLTPSSSQNSNISQIEGRSDNVEEDSSKNPEELVKRNAEIESIVKSEDLQKSEETPVVGTEESTEKNAEIESNRIKEVVTKKKKKKKSSNGDYPKENRLSFGSSALAAIIPRANPPSLSNHNTLSSTSSDNSSVSSLRNANISSNATSNDSTIVKSESMTSSRRAAGTLSNAEDSKFFEAILKGDSDVLNRLIHENKKFMELRAKDSMNPLHFAAFHGQLEALQLMLKGKNELLLRDSHGNTPLHSAVTRDHNEIASFLTRTDPSLVWEVDQDGDNVFHLASSLGSIKSMESIIDILGKEEVAKRIGEKNSSGKNCVHLAASLQEGKMVNYLLKNFSTQLGVDQEDDLDQKTPLHYAAAAGSLASATELIEFGAKPNLKDKWGDTALHLAARSAPESVVALLIRKGAPVGALNNQQKTAMHLATEEGKDEVCYILTTNGADVSIRYQWAGRKKMNKSMEDLQVTSQADRWGYINSEKNMTRKASSVPSNNNNSPANSSYLAKIEAKQIEKERVRSQKWASMVSNWDEFMSKKEKQFKKRLIKGIPDCLRGPIWRKLIGCDILETKNVGKYQELLTQPSTWVEQIDLDVNRSARNHVQFKDRFGTGQVALFNVLKAYSVYDKEVGYCQGMSDMAAFLLMHVIEEDVFWILVELCSNSKYDLHGRFLAGFPLLKQSFWIWDRIFEENLPKLFNHFNNQDTPVLTTFYATKWFLTVFLDAFPFKITVRLWDLFLYYGYDIVYSITFAIMKWFEKKLMVCSFDEILGLFRAFEEMNDIDPDEFVAFIVKHEIKAAKIRKLEAEYKVLKDSGKEDHDFIQENKNRDKKSKK
eukprot:TRINITY_DN4941_c1_g1_i3.p1 TRINITY_DN4941_c1_g1~~TRINITY_DN4941_c1_g1_i3.p1  ORF type:complete len:1016 (-),score=462.63 TRINITY_DN4941_c1_g1_i3:38-3085(-)